ncbi:GNAT family N-acetyltransferase [Streptomyces sp. CC53]|uniref:GNAT family N-acetyltransferase n=1 Tax=unclassified Streptomyces TaxID=2593676 RepID=UPI0008DD0D65|nr:MULTISPECIES: GNAT family N-acetyltransferase [unclassified Streptomyces]OII63680.1 GNAT family N-acetyltransferase [Streptomyces sp. CC53]
MDLATVLDLYDRTMRRNAHPDGPGARVERDGGVVRQTGPAHAWNGVLWSGLTDATADAAIAAQIRHYTDLGRPFEWKLHDHDGPRDLGERLRAAGFRAEPEEALMVAGSAALATTPLLPEGITLLAVTRPAHVRLVTDVHEAAFGADAERLRARLVEQLAARPDAVAAVVALADGRPVSSARLELTPGGDFAGLWGGGTVPEWRGRGLYRALVAHRARIAAERGYRHLLVDASDMSRPILRRLGFARLGTTTPYVYEPATTG